MSLNLSKLNLTEINAGLSTISTALPLLVAAYEGYRAIWAATHPGETEAQFLAALQTASLANVDQSSAILVGLGYVQQSDGSWKAPTTGA